MRTSRRQLIPARNTVPGDVGSTRLRLAMAAAVLSVATILNGGDIARAVTIDWVTVGDPGNTADTTGDPNPAGSVADEFDIMKFEFTNSQYTDFLNAVDPAGANPNAVYNSLMGSDARGGIRFTTGAASGSKYAVKTNMADKPVNYVSWFDAARVANWLQNGQGSGSTETGAYTLNNATSGTAPAVNAGARFYIPTENQWYKAAYYKGGSANAGYWNYPTQSDTVPSTVSADGAGNGSAGSIGNFANHSSGADWNSQDGNVTTVGTNGGPGAYGTFDMGGNVFEWNDLTGAGGTSLGQRGGNWFNSASFFLSSAGRTENNTANEQDRVGFRLASSVAVPEPSTWVMGLAGIACGGWGMWRRRRRI